MSEPLADRPLGRLTGRGVIVTGASGIAAASARLFAAEGARVAIVSRTEERCRALVETIEADGGTASYAVADLADEAQAAGAMDAAGRALGRVDGLLNVAGGSGRPFGDGPLHTLTADAWDRTLELNARSHVLATAPVLRAMLSQERDAEGSRGAVVNTTSVLASRPVPRLFATHAYAAAKGALLSLTIATAAYYATEGIRVNAIAPALTTSRMSERAASDPDIVAFARARQPLSDGFLAAEDVAAAALYLISPQSRAVTGQVLAIDGGWSVASAG
jgi:NAD(P)-dependent dehydrogenase (short-subunit alcohol dehydrogenase family)